MATVLTIAGENLIALKQAQGKTLNIDQFVLALIPGLDPNQPIDRFTTIPDTDKIKYTYAIPQDHKGYIAPNQVVYSMLLTSDVGDFDFNWVGLYSSEDKTLIAVIHLPELKKFKSDAEAGTLGNNLVRNVLLEFTGAKGTTNITVEASTWQIDFTARLKDIDERERLSNRDIYGAKYFFADAYLVTNKVGSFAMQPGTAYVEGVRIDLPAEQTINDESLPKSVYLDVCMSPHESTVRAKATPIYEDKPDYVDENNVAHYITKIAEIAADGTVTDKRGKGMDSIIADASSVKTLHDALAAHAAKINAHKTPLDAVVEVDPTLLHSVVEPYLAITDGAAPQIDLAARNRFVWKMGADRVFPVITPKKSGEWHINVYPGDHILTLHADWNQKIVGELRAGATMHRLALVHDGVSVTLYIDNRVA